MEKITNEELNELYCPPNIFQLMKWGRMRWAGHVARMGERRFVYRVLVGKPEGKIPRGRLRRRWEDNIKMNIQEVGFGGMDRIELARDKDSGGTCECGNEPSGSIKCGEYLDWLRTG